MNIYDKAHELANQIKTNEDVVRYKELRDELYRLYIFPATRFLRR